MAQLFIISLLNHKFYLMFNNKKLSTGKLIAAGLAAFACYKYSKMSSNEKEQMASNLKDHAQKLYEKYIPADIRNMFSKKGPSTPENVESRFGEGVGYSG